MGDAAGIGEGARPRTIAWTPPSERETPAIRGVGDVLSEALRVYRRRWRDLLALSLLTEGLVTLIALPYTISAGNQTLDLVRSATGGTPITPALALPRIVTDPALAALGGVLSVVPLGGTLILIAAVTALLLAPQPEAHRWRGALSRALEVRVPILGPVVALAIFAGVIQIGVASVAGVAGSISVDTRDGAAAGQLVALAIFLLALAPALVIAAIYLAVRWAVAVPVLVMEPATLRRSLARSVLLTRHRTFHVALALLLVYGATAVIGGIVSTVALMSTTSLVAGGAALPMLLVPAALHLATRVVLAPLGAVVPALLYRDLKLASNGALGTSHNTNAGPDPSRSAGVP